MTAPTLDIDLTDQPITVLDGMLTRLYAEHVGAEGEARVDAHLKIMAVVREQRRRTDAWLERYH